MKNMYSSKSIKEGLNSNDDEGGSLLFASNYLASEKIDSSPSTNLKDSAGEGG